MFQHKQMLKEIAMKKHTKLDFFPSSKYIGQRLTDTDTTRTRVRFWRKKISDTNRVSESANRITNDPKCLESFEFIGKYSANSSTDKAKNKDQHAKQSDVLINITRIGKIWSNKGAFLSIQSIAPSCSLQLNINSAVDKSYNNNDIEVL